MGDSIDGSSSAAQGAPGEQAKSQPQTRGIFHKLLGVFGAGRPRPQAVSMPQNSAPRPGLLNLRRMRVEDVMVPKADIVSINQSATKDELVEIFRGSGMTRLPVYDGTLDTPLGLIHLKDFALSHGFNGKGGRFSIKSMLRPLLYVPPSMSIGVLLQKMQTERKHMALVIDEYGGVDGLVTIEDLIEQVVGEIEDEHDTDDDKYWITEKPGQYLALAKTPLQDFETETGFSLTAHDDVDEEEIDTLGGLVFMLAGRVPARGEMVRHPAGPEFEVVEADPRRIKRLRVCMSQAQEG